MALSSGLAAAPRDCASAKSKIILRCCKIILSGCSSTLVYIDAGFCNLEPEGLTAIVSGGGLKVLNVTGLSYLNFRDALAAIGNGFATRLKILSLRMCRTVSDASIVAIAKGCPQLQEWNLALCHEVRVSG
ncbi:F-box/LRR-repeat protein 12-like [Durio zibethinus]|uniref:F-box/LRR-repeat protein 12-like n=1 Tax=Durio zibethinus TaxID=66656 RepID=A0A6P6A5M1_DURZI|nr:F-box/LRR-repeat protein 12-like [Durio zibethinus]